MSGSNKEIAEASDDIVIRKSGRAGRMTLNRPDALNALTWDMCLAVEAALDAWREDDEVALVVVDAAGDRAFCAGGDLGEMYRTGKAGDFAYGRRFWTDEYRMNAKIAEYPKPYIVLMQGFTMGGGVGVSCHGSHRVVGDTTKISMPECAVGLTPDVGGSLLLSRAPGYLGAYLGVTAYRMGPGDAVFAGFADTYVPEAHWPELVAALERTGDPDAIEAAAHPRPAAPLEERVEWVAGHFRGATIGDVIRSLDGDRSPLSAETRSAIFGMSPHSVACTYEIANRVRGFTDIRRALEMEYRFTFRAMEHGDFLEGIRAAIIDKDRRPNWRHAGPEDVTPLEVARMLMPLGADRLSFEETTG